MLALKQHLARAYSIDLMPEVKSTLATFQWKIRNKSGAMNVALTREQFGAKIISSMFKTWFT